MRKRFSFRRRDRFAAGRAGKTLVCSKVARIGIQYPSMMPFHAAFFKTSLDIQRQMSSRISRARRTKSNLSDRFETPRNGSIRLAAQRRPDVMAPITASIRTKTTSTRKIQTRILVLYLMCGVCAMISL